MFNLHKRFAHFIVSLSFEQFHSKAKIAQRDRLPDELRLTAGQRKALTEQRRREEQARKLLEMATKPEPKKKKKWRPNQQRLKSTAQ